MNNRNLKLTSKLLLEWFDKCKFPEIEMIFLSVNSLIELIIEWEYDKLNIEFKENYLFSLSDRKKYNFELNIEMVQDKLTYDDFKALSYIYMWLNYINRFIENSDR